MMPDPSTPPEAAPLTGFIDHVDWHGFRGWARDPLGSNQPIWLEIMVDDAAPVAFLANLLRPDLQAAGIGDGRHGFDLRFPTPLDPAKPHRVVVRRRDDQVWLPHSPVELAAAPSAAPAARAQFEALVQAEIAAAQDGAALDSMLRFLLQQADQLLQGHADARSGVAALHQFRLRWNDYLEGVRAEPQKPDVRPWALLIDTDLPDTAPALAVVEALQSLGLRVAAIAMRDLATGGAVAQSLAASGVMVLGLPHCFTIEDALRRNRGLFRCVLLRGGVAAAAYGLLARLHQPRARIIAMLGDPARDRTDALANFAGAMLADAVAVETTVMLQTLKTQLPARMAAQLEADAEAAAIAAALVSLGVVQVRAEAAATPPGSPGPA